MNPAPPSSEKEAKLAARMLSLGIHEEDLVETFVRGAGPGGQKINKTSSCVSLAYPAMDVRVKCQASRSLSLNRYRAREELCERVAAILLGEKTKAQQEAENSWARATSPAHSAASRPERSLSLVMSDLTKP